MIRLFVAIPLPENVRKRLESLCCGLRGAKWIRPENMHLTLRFIGGAHDDTAGDFDAALAQVRAPGFDLTLDEVGRFGRGRNPHAVWAGVVKSEPLMRLQAKIDSALVRAGCPPEGRKFSAHVTTARLNRAKSRDVEAWVAGRAAFHAGPFTVDRFALYSSHLASAGAIHTVEEEYMLEGCVKLRSTL